MSLGRWCVAAFVLAACGGRAIVDADASTPSVDAGAPSADAGASIERDACADERSTFSASATLIDHEFAQTCTDSQQCSKASLQTRCVYTCLAGTADDISAYANALTSTSEQCSACAEPSLLDPCADTIVWCADGRCAVGPWVHPR